VDVGRPEHRLAPVLAQRRAGRGAGHGLGAVRLLGRDADPERFQVERGHVMEHPGGELVRDRGREDLPGGYGLPAAHDLPRLDLALLLGAEMPGQQLDGHPDRGDGEPGQAEDQGDDGGRTTATSRGRTTLAAAAVRPVGVHTVTVYPVAMTPGE